MTEDLVVMLTALNLEYEAVRARLFDLRLRRHARGTRFEVGTVRGGTCRVALALTGKGNQSAGILAERAIEQFSPAAVLFVGVAGALWDTMPLGDVVMATQVYHYHGGTSEDDGLKSRPRSWEAAHALLQLATHISRGDAWREGLAAGPHAPKVVGTAVTAHPFPALLALAAAAKGGRTAATRWLYIISERRRLEEDRRDHEHTQAQRMAAYERWTAKLNAARPSEGEMEHWLNCDKTILLGNALRHYHLVWRDVIAYAVLQVPAKYYRRARVTKGPWRYTKYDILLFLVTEDGVREVSSELDFENVTLREAYRTNYRFAAISSVHVARANESAYTLELTLTNGPTKSLRITEPDLTEIAPDEDPAELAKINLDATGLTHTLHVLEGIAAEGRAWIGRNLRGTGTVEDDPE